MRVIRRKVSRRSQHRGSSVADIRRVLDKEHCDSKKTIDVSAVVLRVTTLAQLLAEKKFYPYQISLVSRLVESILMHDGDVVTALFARQSGKTECVGGITAAIALVIPLLAAKFPDDWHLNITDRNGNYRGFVKGISLGIYAPRQDQAATTFERVRRAMETRTANKILSELHLGSEINNGNELSLTNGSSVICKSASEQSKIEGATHHVLILEEAQDIGDMKVRKSLHPMTASTMGSIIKIGTAGVQRCDFWTAIQENIRLKAATGVTNHFFFPHIVCSKFNSLYKQYIEKERIRVGADSDEFRMSYNGEWIFERGMFVSHEVLFSRDIAQLGVPWGDTYPKGLPESLGYYSIIAAIDWGRSHDSTVVCLMAVNWNDPLDSFSDGRLYTYKKHIIDWLEFLGDDYEFQFGEIQNRLEQIPQLKKVIVDANACGIPMYDRLAAVFKNRDIEIEPFVFSKKTKSEGYKSFSRDLSAKRVTYPSSPKARQTLSWRKFVIQMMDLRKDYSGGYMMVAHPDERGAHDDYCDAAMLASWGANTPAFGGKISIEDENPFL